MHAYLKTIGFSKIKTTKELQEILRDVVENYDRKKIVETEEHHLFAEFSKEYAYDCGITVCGEIDENNRFQMEYYYPYFEGGQISSYEEVSVERHVDKESFAGACDDMRLGITMILLVFGTAYQLFFTVITGYAMSREKWFGKNFVMNMILVTMFFGGGLVPYYFLIKSLGLYNSLWVMIIPGAIAEARAAADYVTKREAGAGAVREVCDHLFAAHGNKPRR